MSTQAKSAVPRKAGHRKPKRSYAMYVSRMFNVIDKNGESGLSGDAKAVATSMTANLINDVSMGVKSLLSKDKKMTASAKDVLAVVSMMIPANRVNQMKADVEKVFSKYYPEKQPGGKPKPKDMSRQQLSGLILPVARIQGAMKEQKVGSRVSPSAAVVVAAFVQNQMMEVLADANEMRKENGKAVRVTAHDINLALLEDGNKLFTGTIKHGGVEAHVEPALESKKRKRADSAAAMPKKAKK